MHTDEPLKTILDRELWEQVVNGRLGNALGLIEDVVNYGTNLIPRCFESSEREIPDIVIAVHFLKHAVTLLDSVGLLVSKAAIISSHLPLRGLLELSLYLDWILKRDTEKRATLYYVWDLRRKLYWTNAFRHDTREHAAHKIHMKDAPIKIELRNVTQRALDQQIASLERILRSNRFKPINDQFDKIKKGARDPAWYAPEGIPNIRKLAIALKREWEYKTLYAFYSQVVHGDVFDEHVAFESGQVVFEPIRSDRNADQVLSNSLTYTFDIYQDVTTYYRPEELSKFRDKYMNDWRNRYRSLFGKNK